MEAGMELYGSPWRSMEVFGSNWELTEVDGSIWKFMDAYGSWFGSRLRSMEFHVLAIKTNSVFRGHDGSPRQGLWR